MRAAALLALALTVASPAFAEAVRLKPQVEVAGPEITLGDLFVGAGDAAATPVAPAPRPGSEGRLSPALVAAAAQEAGLSWTPAANAGPIVVRTAMVSARAASARAVTAGAGYESGGADVRRGEVITVTYAVPGALRISTRAKALESAGVGETVRVANVQGERIFEARVTGPGAAEALVAGP